MSSSSGRKGRRSGSSIVSAAARRAAHLAEKARYSGRFVTAPDMDAKLKSQILNRTAPLSGEVFADRQSHAKNPARGQMTFPWATSMLSEGLMFRGSGVRLHVKTADYRRR